MTLAVHPRCGEPIVILGPYGPDAVWAETTDGQLTILPTAWTDEQPRAAPLTHDGRPVHLALERVLALATWVAARTGNWASKRAHHP